LSEDELGDVVEGLGMNRSEVKECADSDVIKDLVTAQENEIKEAGVYGTPTVFIDGEPIVGPKPYRVYARLIKTE